MKLLRVRTHGATSLSSMLGAMAQLFGSRLLGQAAGFLAMVLAARGLGPTAFGLYAFAVTLAVLISQVPGSGIDMSAVRISSRYWESAPNCARGVLLLAGAAKLALSLGLTLLLIGLVGPLADFGALDSELVWPIRSAALIALALAAIEYAIAALQAREQFGQIAVVNLLAATLKLAPVAILLAAALLSLNSALLALLVASYLAAAAGLWVVWRHWGGPTCFDRAIAGELWSFSSWFLLATMLGTVANSLDTLVLTPLAGATAMGIYASARTLAMPIAIVGGTAGAVLLPRLSRRAAQGPLGPYVLRTGLTFAALVGGLCLASVLAAPLLLPLVFGPRYTSAVLVFQLLALAYGLQAVTWPILTLLMALDQPQVIAGLNFVLLLLVGTGYLVVVPTMGALGAALVLLAAYALLLGPYLLFAQRALRERDGRVPGLPEGALADR